jgi:hypothetical protein
MAASRVSAGWKQSFVTPPLPRRLNHSRLDVALRVPCGLLTCCWQHSEPSDLKQACSNSGRSNTIKPDSLTVALCGVDVDDGGANS